MVSEGSPGGTENGPAEGQDAVVELAKRLDAISRAATASVRAVASDEVAGTPAASLDQTFGKNIRVLREAKGLTQAELAARVTEMGTPMHQQSVYKVEAGDRRVQLTEAAAMAKVFNVPIEDLIQPVTDQLSMSARVREALATLQQSYVAAQSWTGRYADAKRLFLAEIKNITDSGRHQLVVPKEEQDLVTHLLTRNFVETSQTDEAEPAQHRTKEAVEKVWPRVLRALKSRDRRAWLHIDGAASVLSVEDDTLTLEFVSDDDHRIFILNEDDAVLEAALNEILGGEWLVRAIVEPPF